MKQPFNCKEGMELKNRLIKGTKVEKYLIEFNKKRFLYKDVNNMEDTPDTGELSNKY